MNTRYLLQGTLAALVFFASHAVGETKRLRPKRMSPNRTVASIEKAPSYASSRVEQTGPQKSKLGLRISASAGYFSAVGSDANNASELGASSDRGLSFLLAADLTLATYFGVEAELSTGLKSNQSNSVQGESVFTETRSRGLNAVMANFKVQAPIKAGKMRFIPKAGLGYGALVISDQTSFSGFDEPTSSITSRVNTPYFVAGLEYLPMPRWRIGFDFSKSVGGSGRLGFGNPDNDVAASNPSLQRIRASIGYRITPSLTLGGQFIQRNVGFSFPLGDGSSFDSSVKQSQFLGQVQFDL